MDAALWQTISTVVSELAERLTGLRAQWINEPRLQRADLQRVYLEVFSVRSLGVDELRAVATDDPPPSNNMRQRLTGNRHVTITVTVESLSQAPTKSARVFVEQFRFGMRRPSSLAALRAANLALVGMQPLGNRDRTQDDRFVSVASLDLTIACSANDADREEEATTTIDTVELQNRVTDVDGLLLPESIAPRSELVGYVPAAPEELVDVTQVPGIVDAWDPTDPGSMNIETGGRITEWHPLVETYNTLVTDSGSPSRPLYAPDAFGLGYAGVQFDGVDDRLSATANDIDWGSDVTVVFAAASSVQAGVIVEYADEAGPASPGSFSVESRSGRTQARAIRPGATSDLDRVGGAYTDNVPGAPGVFSVRFKRSIGAYLFRVDFENVHSASLPEAAPLATIGTPAFSFGGSRTTPRQFWGGILGRVVFFNRVLQPDELLDVERWVAAGAGLYTPPSEATLCLPPGAEFHGYWRFNGNGQDASGNARHLSFGTEPPPSFVPGVRGAALSVAGDPARRAHRTVPDTALEVRSTDFTIQAWVRFADTTGDQVLMEKFSAIGQGWTLIKLFDDTVMFFGDLAGGFIGAPPPITPNVWHHLIVRRAGSVLRMWFDGAVILDAAASGSFSTQTGTPFQIGRRGYAGAGVAALNGSIDEVAFWRRALSDGEVNQLWNGGSGYPICVP